IEPQWNAKLDEIPNEIHDRAGLARFLNLLCSKPFAKKKLTFDELLERAKKNEDELLKKGIKNEKFKLNRSKLVRLHYGIASISEIELLKLAEIYHIEPTLFYNYLSPAFMYAIAVDTEKEMKSLPSTFNENKKSEVTYTIPYRRLAFSDIAIALVTMEPGSISLDNKHPGYELLKPLEGQIVINIDNHPHPPIKQGEFAFFRSHISHTVSNKGEKLAKVLVIRFLE
ncbi:MAG: cupin domain-containing protein, partial [Sedimentisphaerales bacterium]